MPIKIFQLIGAAFDNEEWHRWIPIIPVITEDGWIWWLWPIWRRRVWCYAGWEGCEPGNEWSLSKPREAETE
jgi:hypothetical protein